MGHWRRGRAAPRTPYSEPKPPSSQSPSNRWAHVFEQRPQSAQSVPGEQSEYSDPGPPSSQSPSREWTQKLVHIVASIGAAVAAAFAAGSAATTATFSAGGRAAWRRAFSAASAASAAPNESAIAKSFIFCRVALIACGSVARRSDKRSELRIRGCALVMLIGGGAYLTEARAGEPSQVARRCRNLGRRVCLSSQLH